MGGMIQVGPKIARTAEPEFPVVVSVSVVVTVSAPGVTLAGEKDAVHLPGSPDELKDTEESNGPPSGFTSMV